MNTKTIYRIEDDEGRGMYQRPDGRSRNFSDIHEYLFGESWNDEIQPPPEDDMEYGFGWKWGNRYRSDFREWKDFFFGFITKKQLVMWTRSSECRTMLHELGLRVSVYEVDSKFYYNSARQAVFDIEKSTLVRTESLLSYN